MAVEEQKVFNPRGLYLERVGDSSNGYKELIFPTAISRIGKSIQIKSFEIILCTE